MHGALSSPVILPVVGRAPLYRDAVAWLEALRDVADANGHGQAARYAVAVLDLVAAAHDAADAGYGPPDLLAALLPFPRSAL